MFNSIAFSNEKIKGQIEIEKTGETFIIENGNFYYENNLKHLLPNDIH